MMIVFYHGKLCSGRVPEVHETNAEFRCSKAMALGRRWQSSPNLRRGDDRREQTGVEEKTKGIQWKFEAIIKLNVGGTSFATTLTTLRRFPTSLLGVMFSGRHRMQKDENGAYFIDRDGAVFRYILSYLRAPENFSIDLVAQDERRLLMREFDFFGLHFPALWSARIRGNWATYHTVEVQTSGTIAVDDQEAFLCQHCGSVVTRGGNYFDALQSWPSSVVEAAYTSQTDENCPACGGIGTLLSPNFG